MGNKTRRREHFFPDYDPDKFFSNWTRYREKVKEQGTGLRFNADVSSPGRVMPHSLAEEIITAFLAVWHRVLMAAIIGTRRIFVSRNIAKYPIMIAPLETRHTWNAADQHK